MYCFDQNLVILSDLKETSQKLSWCIQRNRGEQGAGTFLRGWNKSEVKQAS